MSQFFEKEFDKWSGEFSKYFKAERSVLNQNGFLYFFVCLSDFVFYDFSQIERLYLVEINFFMQNLHSEIPGEIVCLVLVSGDESYMFQEE